LPGPARPAVCRAAGTVRWPVAIRHRTDGIATEEMCPMEFLALDILTDPELDRLDLSVLE
jgi:hypothetical protein